MLLCRRGVVQDLAGLDTGPLVPLEVNGETSQKGQKSQGLHTHLLALIHLGLGSPGQENGDILSHLGGGGGGTILVLDQTIVKDTGHTNGSTGEVGVEVQSLTDLNTSWGILVTGQEREDIVGTSVTSLDHQGQIWGVSSGVSGTSLLLVSVGAGHVVGGLSRAVKVVTDIVGSISVLVLLSFGLDLGLGVGDTDQVAPGNTVERVASSANLLVDLVTTANAKIDGIVETQSATVEIVTSMGSCRPELISSNWQLVSILSVLGRRHRSPVASRLTFCFHDWHIKVAKCLAIDIFLVKTNLASVRDCSVQR